MMRRPFASRALPWRMVARIALGAVVSASGCSREEPTAEIEPAVTSPPRTFPAEDAAAAPLPPITPPPRACAPSDAFGAPVRIDLGESADDTSPRLSPDEGTVYFASDRPGGRGARDLYEASRAAPDAPFDAPRPLTALATDEDERDPAPSADGLLLVYSSGEALRVARRVDREAPFASSDALDGLERGARHPFLSTTPLALWVTLSDDDDEDVWVARLSETGAFEPAKRAAGIARAGAQTGPVLSADGLELFFLSSPLDGGAPDAGAKAVLVSARRTSLDSPFGPAVPVSGLSPGAEPGWLSSDGCRLYFSAPRAGAGAGRAVFVASRAR